MTHGVSTGIEGLHEYGGISIKTFELTVNYEVNSHKEGWLFDSSVTAYNRSIVYSYRANVRL